VHPEIQQHFQVFFIARGANLAALKSKSLTLDSVHGDLHLPKVNATDKPARILEILSPAKFEKFFEAMGDLMKQPGPDTPQKLAELAAAHQNVLSMDWVEELKSTYKLKLLGEP